MASKGKNRGRQKIQMVKMENENNLHVTFSKRRTGLFKKASELCTLCAAQVAIIVFSPGQKVYSFGHPCVESVIDRFLAKDSQPLDEAQQLIEAQRNVTLKELNSQFIEAEDVFNDLKKSCSCKKEMLEARRGQQWWESPSEKLCSEQLQELLTAMIMFKENLDNFAEKKNMMEAAVSLLNINNIITTSSNSTRGVSITRNHTSDGTRASGSRALVSYDARTSASSGTMVLFDATRASGSRAIGSGFGVPSPLNYRASAFTSGGRGGGAGGGSGVSFNVGGGSDEIDMASGSSGGARFEEGPPSGSSDEGVPSIGGSGSHGVEVDGDPEVMDDEDDQN